MIAPLTAANLDATSRLCVPVRHGVGVYGIDLGRRGQNAGGALFAPGPSARSALPRRRTGSLYDLGGGGRPARARHEQVRVDTARADLTDGHAVVGARRPACASAGSWVTRRILFSKRLDIL